MVDITDYENSIAAENENSDNKQDITIALKQLNEDERDLIIKRYLEDMSLIDISNTTALPLGTVKSKISRTLKKLRVLR